MPHAHIPRISLVATLGLALFFAACGGHSAPGGYTCDFAGSYCATYAHFGPADFSAAGLAGAYVNISNAHLTCTGVCANPSNPGYIANLLMLIGSDNNSWVEAGVWSHGTYPGSNPVEWLEGAATGGVPHYRPLNPVADGSVPTNTMGIEIRSYSDTPTDSGYIFRFTSFFYQNGITYTGEFTGPTLALNQGSTPVAPLTPLTNVEIGEFLHGTDGATAETSGFTPIQATNSIAAHATDFTDALPSGFPTSVYPITLTHGEPLNLYHHTADQPPYGVWFTRGASRSAPASPAHTPALFECCTPGFTS